MADRHAAAVSVPAVAEEPTASLAHRRPTDTPFPSAQETPKFLSLSPSEASYQRLNPTVHTD